jgi:SH3-like domain-containing protein
MRRIGMNRLLLSLWLLGAALYGANTLIYANVIFGWPTTKHKVEAGGAGTEAPKPSASQLAAAQTETAASDASATATATSPVPQDQAASSAPAQPQQAQDSPSAQPAPEEAVAPTPQSEPEQAQSLPEAQPQQQDENEWVKVSRGGANVRSGPSSSASQLATLPSGMALRVISREAGWVQIGNADGSQTGWVYERLLEPGTAPNEQGAVAAGSAQSTGQEHQGQSEMVKVIGSPATMRSGPSDSAPMLFGFPEGRELRVMSRQPGWVQVIDPGSKQSGWIAEASLATAGAGGQQQQAATAPAQRPSRDAEQPGYDSAEGPPPGAREAWLPWDEDMGPPDGIEEPEDRPRGRGHRHGGFAGILRRAFGGF